MKKILAVSLILLSSSMPLLALSPAPENRPKLDINSALSKVADYVKKNKISIASRYVDRAWVGYARGEKERKWIVSYSPDGIESLDKNRTEGWLIFLVSMNGDVSLSTNGVKWIAESTGDAPSKQ